MTHPHPKRSFVPQAVLTKSGKLSTAGATVNTVRPVNTANTKAVNTVRPVNTANTKAVNTVRPVNTANTKAVNTVRSVNIAASKPIVNHPRTKTNAFKRGYSQSSRPFNRHFANKNSIINTNVNTARVKHTTARDRAVVSENKGKGANAVKASACWGNPQQKEYKEKGVIDSGCSRHMTGNKCYLDEYEDYDGGFVSFGDGKGRISGKGKIKTGSLDFDDVYFCKELKYNLFSVSQICDKKNNVLFTDTECLVLSSNFKLLDESQVLLRVPRKDNIYSVDLKSVVPTGGLTCLIAKAAHKLDESKYMIYENDHSCVACQKGKQHKASYKTKLVNSISKPLHMLHMDLFGPTNVKSLMKKSYCLVVTDDFSRFSWVFFLATKDETSGILKTFITEIENQLDHKVKVTRSDNGTEFKNSIMNQFCEMKGIKREFSMARTPQQNGVAKRKNRTLIEAARTMLVDSKLPTTFWAEAVNTACYVLNRVLVIKPHNKTPYELIHGRPPLIDFMKPFRYPVTILNTRDHLGKFDGKADEGYFVGYSVVSKAMRVFNKRTRIVEETLNIRFLENTTNVKGNGPDWLFDIDSLTISMNYVPVAAGNKTNGIAGTKDNIVVGSKDCKGDAGMKPTKVDENEAQIKMGSMINTPVSTAGPSIDTAGPSPPVNTAGPSVSTANESEEQLFERFSPFKNAFTLPSVPNVSLMDNTDIFGNAYDDEDLEEEVDINNVISSYLVPDTSFTKFHKDHPEDQTLVDLPRDKWEIGTKWVLRNKKDERDIVVKNKARLVAQCHTQEEGIDYNEDFAPVARIEAIRLFLAYASFKDFIVYQMDVKSAFLYGKIEEEVYVCQPPGFEDPHFPDKVYKVEKALYGLHQAPRAWYETLSTYLLDNGFHRGQIDKTLFIKRHKDDILLVQVYVDDIIFGSTKKQMSNEFETLMHDKFQMSSMGELSFFLGLQVKQKSDGIFISQDKYVAEILKKFDFASVKTASTPMETNKALIKDEEAEDVDVHLYRSMIGSLMYLTASRPDIMFVVCACARFQVTPKTSHLNVVKRIFRYLKGQPKLGLWYPRDSPFDLEAFLDNDYARASLDRKSTTGGCQFLGKRLISWQCKKQTIVANSTTKAEYVAAANCCRQVLWIQNQMLDLGFNFMNTKIYIDNESTSVCEDKHIEVSGIELRGGLSCPNLMKRHVSDEVVHKELGDRTERAATTASSLEAEQDSGSGPRCQDTILGDVYVQTRFETTSKQFNDPPLSKVNTFGSGEDSMQLMELMAHCTILFEFVSIKEKRDVVSQKQKERCVLKNRKSALIGVNTARPQLNTANIKLVLLVKSEGSEGFHEIIDFLTSSHIYYALTECLTLYISLIEIFWQTAALSTTEDKVRAITATIDGRDKIITEASIRRHLTLKILERHTPGSDEGRLKHDELMELVTKLSNRVVDVEEDLKQTKKTYTTALTKLVLKVKKLEKQVRSNKARRRARIVLSEDEDAAEDPSKQGRKIAQIDTYPTISISLVQDEGTSWKMCTNADVPVSTASAEVSTATYDVSTAAAALVYIRRSASKAKDKGKAIM
ncbi:putative ribonuclease H-like domain-containing protein [Tanacetum coccineum]